MSAYARWALINFLGFHSVRLWADERLLTFGAFRVSAYSRWTLINFLGFQSERLFEMGAY